MSENMAPNSILSREELGALLETMATSARNEQARHALRPAGVTAAVGSRSELLRIARVFAEEQGRSLSTLYQTPVTLELSHWEEITLQDFASALLEEDRVARMRLGGGHGDAWLFVNRPLFFGWMMLAFGSRPAMAAGPVPDRPYTRIEERFMTRVAEECALTLTRRLSGAGAADVRLTCLETPGALLDHGPRPQLVTSFDVHGLGELARLRMALPASVVEGAASERPAPEPEVRHELEHELFDVYVDVRAEVGEARLDLSEVVALEPGTVIPLDGVEGGEVVLRIGDRVKFRAERGSVDRKLAVRILEAL